MFCGTERTSANYLSELCANTQIQIENCWESSRVMDVSTRYFNTITITIVNHENYLEALVDLFRTDTALWKYVILMHN